VRNFYAKAVTELKDCFNFDDEVYGLLSMILKPKNARQLSPKSLVFFLRYPILRDHVNEGDAVSEWRAHVNLADNYFNVSSDLEYHSMDSEFYWNRVFASKSPSGEPQFPNLKVSFFLCHSVMHPPKDFSATSKTRNLRKKMVYTTNLLMH